MSVYKGYTESQKKATANYKKSRDYVQMVVDMPREQRERYKTFAATQSKSLAKLIVELLEREMGENHD